MSVSNDLKQSDDDPGFKGAQYRAFGQAAFASYVDHSIFSWIKSDQRHVIRRLMGHADLSSRTNVILADIATGNGQFLFHLNKAFPKWSLRGYDYTAQFIESARNFPGLQAVEFECKDFFEMTDQFDVVTFLGTLPVFPDFTLPLAKLLGLVRPGGRLIVDGYFNKFDVDVRIAVRDNSVRETAGIWRSHSNHHSEASVSDWLTLHRPSNRVEAFEFIDMPMEDEIEGDLTKPHLNAWTFRDQQGEILVTNGTNLIFRTRMLDIKLASS